MYLKNKSKILQEKGITLIALVVTIIVLLILAGISISMLTGNNGILTRAQEAKNKTEEAEKEEKDKLGDMEDIINEYATGITVEQVTDENPGVLETEGTDTYVINSIEDLVFFANDVTNGNTYEGKTVKLGLSLDFNSNKSYVDPLRTDYAQYGYDGELKTLLTSGEGFKPIGTELTDDIGSNSFNGIFDGNRKSIYNLYINKFLEGETKFIGLFGNNFGKIQNLELENIKIQANVNTDTHSYIGGIAARNRGGNIYSCGVSGEFIVNGENQSKLVGGITGFNREAEINKCYNYADITCTGYYMRIGGIAAVSSGGYITDSYNSGNLCGNHNISTAIFNVIGGITGETYSQSRIERCYNKGNIVIEDVNCPSMIAGIVGYNTSGLLKDIYNIGKLNIDADSGDIGGIVGQNLNDSNVSNAHNLGEIYSTLTTSTSGMLCGKNQANIDNSYSINFNNNNLFGIAGTNSNCDFKIRNDMANIFSILGLEFKEDVNNINGEYPILNWQ